MKEPTLGPSTAIEPDLDWSQVRETVRMLFLAVAQIDIAMRESDDSVEKLTEAFTAMMSYEKAIERAVEELPDDPETRAIRDSISDNVSRVTQQMSSAIVAFQFYDKLAQRMGHVGKSIEGLSELVSDTSRIYNPIEWQYLQTAIKSGYSMREEHEMFESVMQGGDVHEAIRSYHEAHKEDLDDDIEFF